MDIRSTETNDLTGGESAGGEAGKEHFMRDFKVPVFKRLGLGLMQHLVAAVVFVLLAEILFNSFLTVSTMNGQKTYFLDPLSQKTTFEESEIFQDLFQTAVSDVIRLGIIRDQMETDGQFDAAKTIDVTSFMKRYGTPGMDYGTVTAEYKLEDLVIWYRYGLEYKVRTMSLSDFVNYYGEAIVPENFKLDEYGNLTFAGYNNLEEETYVKDFLSEYFSVEDKMAEYTTGQLEDMAFSYVMGRIRDGVTLNKEDDGSLTVYINVLSCRFPTVDKKTQLFDLADNWWDYVNLQNNVAETSRTLAENYRLYQDCAGLYEEGHGNLQYAIQMRNETGEKEIFSNISGLTDADEGSITEFFEDYRHYLIYYPNSLEIMGTSNFTENNIYDSLRKAHYPYLEDVCLWIGLDTTYQSEEDAFYYADKVFEGIVPNTAGILTILITLILIWIGLLLYLTVTAGVAYGESGEAKRYLNAFDKIWTEVFLVLMAVTVYGGYLGVRYLKQMTLQVYEMKMTMMQWGMDRLLLELGSYALFGFLVSMFCCLFWYSIVRRLKSLNFYRHSMLRLGLNGVSSLFETVLGHQSSLISVLLPYIIFLMINFLSMVGILFMDRSLGKAVLAIVLLVIDLAVGIRLFRRNAELNDIIEGINRIRFGEVEYKLEPEKLHGVNKFLADAVNNIGDGIDNAVKTSVKDERLKTDLITNVSHDLKTPLTSIINYVDLLKRQNIENQLAKGYIDVLESKSQRLKDLTDDLVEASKISSGNIVLNMEVLNLGELLQQAVGELSEKLEAAKLQVVAEMDERPALVCADSRRMWRVMENLFNNICKYSMEGTRVYAEIRVKEDKVTLQMKNVSKTQMNIHADELTERFIRGDSSRSTEGSGLGLYIAKSLTNAMGGDFEIQLDGDLFKVNITFPLTEAEHEAKTDVNASTKEASGKPQESAVRHKAKSPD